MLSSLAFLMLGHYPGLRVAGVTATVTGFGVVVQVAELSMRMAVAEPSRNSSGTPGPVLEQMISA